jgi:hypothetical protein
LAFSAGQIADTVIEAINKVGSAFYGPIVATFLLAILSKKVHTRAMNIGLLTGVGLNVYIWQSGIPIFWIWWNFIGAAVTLLVAYGLSLVLPASPSAKKVLEIPRFQFARSENYILLAFFGLLVWFCIALPGWFQ